MNDDEIMDCPTCGEEFEADYWNIGDRLKRAALADAAPDLLAVAQGVAQMLRATGMEPRMLAAVEAAIDKATSTAPTEPGAVGR